DIAAKARKMNAAQVAETIASNYTNERFDSTPFKGNAADLELTRGYRKLLLSSKRFKAANTGIEPLKQLVAAGSRVEATGYLYVTLGEISAPAREFARDNDIELIQATELANHFSGKARIV
ncbi:MAG: restriction endonuclease, partial [Pseudomonadota bacterium]